MCEDKPVTFLGRVLLKLKSGKFELEHGMSILIERRRLAVRGRKTEGNKREVGDCLSVVGRLFARLGC